MTDSAWFPFAALAALGVSATLIVVFGRHLGACYRLAARSTRATAGEAVWPKHVELYHEDHGYQTYWPEQDVVVHAKLDAAERMADRLGASLEYLLLRGDPDTVVDGRTPAEWLHAWQLWRRP